MIKKIVILSFLVFELAFVFAQVKPVKDSSRWEFNAATNLYFIPDDFFVLPVFRADKDKLHLEARYNYEDRETFSGWVGYNFAGGNKLEYAITPMIGGVVGLSDGIAPGIEATLNLKRFEWYSEGEYFFDFNASENSYFYCWTDFAYAPTDWLWFGISGQRTRVYQTDLDIQRGLLIGAGFKQWELNTYAYNIGTDDFFVLLGLSMSF